MRPLAVAAVERHLERRDLPVVQRLPRRDDRAARVQRLLLRLGEDVRLLVALDTQLVLVGRELFGGEQLLCSIVVERDPFEPEEQQVVLDVGASVAADRGEVVGLDVGGVHAPAEERVDLEAREVLREIVRLVEQRAHRRRIERRDRAAVPRREILRALDEGRPAGARLGGVGAEVRKIPAHVLGTRSSGRHQAGA